MSVSRGKTLECLSTRLNQHVTLQRKTYPHIGLKQQQNILFISTDWVKAITEHSVHLNRKAKASLAIHSYRYKKCLFPFSAKCQHQHFPGHSLASINISLASHYLASTFQTGMLTLKNYHKQRTGILFPNKELKALIS